MGGCLSGPKEPVVEEKSRPVVDSARTQEVKAATPRVVGGGGGRGPGGAGGGGAGGGTGGTGGTTGSGKGGPATDMASVKSASALAMARPQPPDDEIDRLFEAFMESKLFKEDVKQTMRSMPQNNKWVLLCQEKYNVEPDVPQKWVDTLASDSVTLDQLRSLRVVLGGQGKAWISEFVELGGLTNLLAQLSTDQAGVVKGFNMEVMRCLKAFMNNRFGLNLILGTPAAVESIALTLIDGSDQLRIDVIDMLTVIAWLSVEGQNAVTEAMQHPRFGRRFKIIVDALASSNSKIDVKLAMMTFVNAMINACDLLDSRIAVRRYFLDLEILEVIQDLRGLIDRKRAADELTDQMTKLTAQFDVFEEAYVSDTREVTRNEIDLSDPEQLLAHLKESVFEDGFTNQFIRTMHSLMTIPSEPRVGEQIWNNVQYIVHAATGVVADDQDDDENDQVELSYQDLKAMLTEKERLDTEAHQSKIDELEATIEEQRQQVHDLTMANAAQVDELNASLKAASEATEKAKAEHEQQQAALAQQLAAAQQELNKLKAAIKDGSVSASDVKLDENSDAKTPAVIPTAPAVIPTAPAVIPTAPAVIPTAPAVIPTAPGVKIPPAPGVGVPKAPGIPGAPGIPVPPAPGVPRAPGAPGVKAAAVLPPKPVIKPNKRLKALHWTTIPPKDVPKTLWKDIDETKIEFDFTEFEEKFAQKQAKVKVKAADSKTEEKKQQVQLVDSKRAYNISIALSRFKMTHNAIRDTLLSMDDAFGVDQMTALLNMAPTKEELDSVTHYRDSDGDQSLLGTAEKFFMALSTIPRLKIRLELSLFKLTFNDVCAEVRRGVDTWGEAVTAVRDSKGLRMVLTVVLAFGNYLNGSTRKGGAYGFKLSTLEKLRGTKTVDNKMNLLQYLVKTLEDKFPDTLEFVREIELTQQAARLEQSYLEGQLNKLTAGMTKLSKTLESANDDKHDRFKPVMTEFYEEASKKVEELKEVTEKTEKDVKETMTLFGEDPASIQAEEFFKMFAVFVDLFKDAEKELEAIKVREEREAKEAAARAEREAKTQVQNSKAVADFDRKQMEQEKNPKIVDGTLQTLRTNDANQIMQIIRQRRRKRGSISSPPAGKRHSLSRSTSRTNATGATDGHKRGTSRNKRDMMAAHLKNSLRSNRRSQSRK